MNDAIAGLVRLQALDKELETLRQALGQVGPRRTELATRRSASVTAQEQSKKSLQEAQGNRKNIELEIDAKDAAVRKHSSELNSVKSNEAYRALIREIDAAKKEKFLLEDRVLALMEQIDVLQKAAKTSDQEAQNVRVDLDLQERALDAEEARLKAVAETKRAERDAFAGGLSSEARSRYEAVRRGRPGFAAVVAVHEMVCGGCRTGLTPNLVNQVMKGKEIVTCDSCSRILYIVPKPAEPTAGASVVATDASSSPAPA